MVLGGEIDNDNDVGNAQPGHSPFPHHLTKSEFLPHIDETKAVREVNYTPLDSRESICVFVCICLLGFGAYFSYDAVSALQPHFFTGN